MPPASADPRRPAVSVVLPTHDRAALIRRAVESVLAQTFGDLELIVVDDGSRDATAEVVAGIGPDERLRYLRLTENRGAGAARNAGLAVSRGEFLAFQDSDDEWMPDKLARHMEAFRAAPDAGVVYSDMQRVLFDGSTRYHPSPPVGPGSIIDADRGFYRVCGLGIQATVIRRSCFDAVGTFNEAFPALEDLELFIRLSRRTRFLHLALPLVRYYESNGLSKNSAAKVTARRLLLELYERELERSDPWFPGRERAELAAAERKLRLRASRR
jgi:glycosyltransferase involved in cell wall biosynthesis